MKSKGYEEIIQTPINIRPITNIHIIREITSFALKTKEPIYCKDIREHLAKTFGIQLDIYIIRRILKERLGFSFKSCSPRLLTMDNSVLKLKKILFVIKI